MKCSRCGAEVSEDLAFVYQGGTICEDCYLMAIQRPKTCDPWAVYSATRARRTFGQTGGDGLTELQMAIYEFIRENEKVTWQDLAEKFNLQHRQLETQITILRHCELVKGHREGDQHYLVPFSLAT